MARVVLCIGSNLESRGKHVAMAAEWLNSILSDCEMSKAYETPDIHGKGNPYVNMVISGITDLVKTDLEKECKAYEKLQGRNSNTRSRGEVPVDIDIVIWEDTILRPDDFEREYFRRGFSSIGAEL